MQQVDIADLVETLPTENAWLRILIEYGSDGPTLRYGQAVIGSPPNASSRETWSYESISFVSATVPAQALAQAFSSDATGVLRVSGLDVVVPRVLRAAQVRHRPSFELHDRHRAPKPSFEYAISREGGSGGGNFAWQGDFLVGPDSPSFTDLDSAYRAFFLGKYDVPANESVPSDLFMIRVVDGRAWLGPIHVRATEMAVEVRGTAPAGTTLEYFSPQRRQRYSISGSTHIIIDLPEGLPTSNAWLWLTEGTEWRDYRTLAGPGASAEQLEAAGVEKEQTSRDEQAAVEAIVFGGEGPLVEFKSRLPESGSSSDRIFRTIAAFANGAGGTVVVGVDKDELTVVGLGDDADATVERDRIGQMIRTRVLPTPEFSVRGYVVDGKDVLFIEISPGLAPPYGAITDMGHRDKPQFFVRRGASTYPALPSDLNQLVQEAVSSALAHSASPRWLPR